MALCQNQRCLVFSFSSLLFWKSGLFLFKGGVVVTFCISKYDDTKILQFKDYAKILGVQRPITFVIKNVLFFFFESQRCTKVCFCFLRLHWLQVASRVECQLSNNPTLFWEWNGQMVVSKVGKELPAILVKRNLYISIFITKHISFGPNQRVHNQYKWLAVHPTIAMKWSGEIVEWLLCSGQSTLCFIWYLLFFAFSLFWNISMGICIWRCSDHKER